MCVCGGSLWEFLIWISYWLNCYLGLTRTMCLQTSPNKKYIIVSTAPECAITTKLERLSAKHLQRVLRSCARKNIITQNNKSSLAQKQQLSEEAACARKDTCQSIIKNHPSHSQSGQHNKTIQYCPLLA